MALLIAHLTRGGLCNRLRTMVSAKILADALDRKFKVSWVPHVTCNCRATDLFEEIPTIDLHLLSEEEIVYAVEDRTPRVYPWMNEPGGGMVPPWNTLKRLIAYIFFSTTLFGFVNTAAGS
jgi:hypothetical protein